MADQASFIISQTKECGLKRVVSDTGAIDIANGFTAALSTISRTLKRVGLTKKITQNVAKERSQDLRDDYMERRSHYNPKQMVFIDESGSDRGLAILGRVMLQKV
ncbi:hypothetical protein V2G26_007303 [Clonostachys chloroleuca]